MKALRVLDVHRKPMISLSPILSFHVPFKNSIIRRLPSAISCFRGPSYIHPSSVACRPDGTRAVSSRSHKHSYQKACFWTANKQSNQAHAINRSPKRPLPRSLRGTHRYCQSHQTAGQHPKLCSAVTPSLQCHELVICCVVLCCRPVQPGSLFRHRQPDDR